MGTLNKVIILGNVGKDPEIRYTASGTAVANFSIATSESWKDADGKKQEKTEWHNVVAWRKTAEVVGEYVKKGSSVLVEGKLQTRSYEKDGIKKYVTEIVADSVVFVGKRNAEQTHNAEEPSTNTESSDLPF